jgi:hypothetical protein
MDLDDLGVDWDALLDEAEGRRGLGVGATGMVMKDNWLPEHEYYEADDGQEFEDAEGFEQAKETIRHFIEDFGTRALYPEHHPSHPAFEYEFRAFLHNDDYSYSPALIAKLVQHVKDAYK